MCVCVCVLCFGITGWCCVLLRWLHIWLGCIGCSNNNYASRKECKKCGQPKEESALPAIAMHGLSLPANYAHYFARSAQELAGLKMNYLALQQSLLQQNPNWLYGGFSRYGLQSTPDWTFSGSSSSAGFSSSGNRNQLPTVLNGWRDGDWICKCGFHNYSSRTEVVSLHLFIFFFFFLVCSIWSVIIFTTFQKTLSILLCDWTKEANLILIYRTLSV